MAGLRLGLSNNKIDWLLTDDHDLFVLHLLVLVVSVQNSLDEVLDLGLGLLTRVLVLEVEGGGNVMGQLSLKVNLVDTWVKHAALDIEHAVLILEEFLAVLELVSVVNSLITILSRVMANERALLTTFDLELDMRGLNRLHDFHVDDTGHSVTWLVEGILRLELNSAFGELGPFV